MKVTTVFGLAIALAIGVSAYGAELKSGLQPGDEVPAFEVVKVAGNPHDEVKIGEELCYRCKMGKRPMVVVFARKSDKNLAKLVHALDEVVAKNKDEKKMGAFVTLINTSEADGKKAAEKLVKDADASNIAVVVSKDQPDGPKDFKLDAGADLTVLIYKDGTVAANHALKADGLNEQVAKKIVGDTSKILN